jgi:hypothetical protein
MTDYDSVEKVANLLAPSGPKSMFSGELIQWLGALGAEASIPTAPTNPSCFQRLATALSNKTQLSNNCPQLTSFIERF